VNTPGDEIGDDRPRNPLWIVLGLVAVIGLGFAIALNHNRGQLSPSPQPSTGVVTAFGELAVVDYTANFGGTASCAGVGSYSDIQPATELTVTTDGAQVGTVRLGTGTPFGANTCRFVWAVVKVPLGHRSYMMSLPQRGAVTVSESDLKAAVRLTLGPDHAMLARATCQLGYDC
jgi:hypothetical protein